LPIIMIIGDRLHLDKALNKLAILIP